MTILYVPSSINSSPPALSGNEPFGGIVNLRLEEGLSGWPFRAKSCKAFHLKNGSSQVQNLVITILYVPSSLDSSPPPLSENDPFGGIVNLLLQEGLSGWPFSPPLLSEKLSCFKGSFGY